MIIEKQLVLEMHVDESLEMIVDESFDMIVDESLDMIMDESLMVEDKSLVKLVDETLKLDEEHFKFVIADYLLHIILNGDFPPVARNKETQILEIVPFEQPDDDLKKKLAKNNKAKMVLYNALPKKEYERNFMCKTAKDIWQSLLITHQEESIDSGFARFNTIITSLKALDEGFSSKNYVRMFLRALHPKWREKVTVIEKSGKKERIKSIALKAKKKSSGDETSTSERDDREYAMAVRNFKKFFRRKGKFVRQPKEEKKSFRQRDEKKGKSDLKCFRCGDPNNLIGDCPKPFRNKDQKAFIGGSWSDSKNDAKDKTNDETCLMAQSSNEVCLRTCLELDEWIKDSGCSKHMTGNKSLFSTYKAYDGEHYEDILPVIIDKIHRDKRKEVHARLDFRESPKKRRIRESSQNSSAKTLPIILGAETAPVASKNHIIIPAPPMGRGPNMDIARATETTFAMRKEGGKVNPHHPLYRRVAPVMEDTRSQGDPEDHEPQEYGSMIPPESIYGYKDLKVAFLAYFMQQKKYVKDPVEIHNIKQKNGETIEEFMERFKAETGRMKGAPECMQISRFMHGVNNPELTKRLNEHVPKTMEEMVIATTAFIRGKTAAVGKKKGHTSWRLLDQSKRHAS
ncbi:zf-CCHC domain-containing protein [Tanacetum coccineum]